jgi:hypothetical protein
VLTVERVHGDPAIQVELADVLSGALHAVGVRV